MSNQGSNKPSLIAPLGGVVVGIAVFLGVNITIGRAIIPTPESVADPRAGLSKPVRPAEEAMVSPAATDTYHTVCITCHQAEGQGIAGAFPPLAGSDWLTGNPELPIRIVLLGLSGPIEVKGAKFNAVMPPPPGLNDEKIADAITFARTHFGNAASKVTPEDVAKVRASLAGRTNPLTTDELRALKAAAPAEGAPAQGAAPAAPEGAAPAAAPEAPAAPTKPKAGARKAAPKPAEAPQPATAPQPAAAPQ
jgi:mono/diheme cytochrome c family protein